MCEMKVRVWDDVLKEMLYSRVEQFDDMLGFRFEKHLETENPVYMWETGLKDKNGKEIYEGDVLFHRWNSGYDMQEETISEVKWRNGAFIVDDKKRSDWLLSIHALAERWASVEVIGNIYEHKQNRRD